MKSARGSNLSSPIETYRDVTALPRAAATAKMAFEV
jgi:hypothetical protein